MSFIEILKVLVLGVVEGITEWLPISSTGHMILFDDLIQLNITNEFKEMFLVVIQLGAILAVIALYFNKLNPFNKKGEEKKDTYNLWFKILISCIPAGIIGVLFDDFMYNHLYNSTIVSTALIFYGVVFIVIENINKGKESKTKSLKEITIKTAIFVGLFQILSLVPGTSRSGATIIGGLLLGMDRSVITEYTFMLAIPVMVGASFIKLLKFGFVFTNIELMILVLGMLTAFIISLLTIKYLLKYIKKNNFKVFGWYRILLGITILLYFALR